MLRSRSTITPSERRGCSLPTDTNTAILKGLCAAGLMPAAVMAFCSVFSTAAFSMLANAAPATCTSSELRMSLLPASTLVSSTTGKAPGSRSFAFMRSMSARMAVMEARASSRSVRTLAASRRAVSSWVTLSAACALAACTSASAFFTRCVASAAAVSADCTRAASAFNSAAAAARSCSLASTREPCSHHAAPPEMAAAMMTAMAITGPDTVRGRSLGVLAGVGWFQGDWVMGLAEATMRSDTLGA